MKPYRFILDHIKLHTINTSLVPKFDSKEYDYSSNCFLKAKEDLLIQTDLLVEGLVYTYLVMMPFMT